MNSSKLTKIILPDVSRETLGRLEHFERLFRKWNATFNLVAPSTLADLWSRHILDSAQLASIRPLAGTWVDLGSGGGFPGIVMAILMRERNDGAIHLIESIGKKGVFLKMAMAEAGGAGAEEIAKLRAAFAAGGLKGYRRMELDRLLEQEKSRYVGQLDIALLYARLGEKEQAFARLQRAAEDRNLYVTALNVEPLWDSYRTDPRFVALVRRVGLTP